MIPLRTIPLAIAALLATNVALADEPAAPPGSAPAAAATPPAAHGDDGDKKKHHKDDDEENDAADHTQQTFQIGLHVNRLAKLDLGAGTFEADFMIGYKCAATPCKPNLMLNNGDIKGKPEVLLDEPKHKVYRVKAELEGEIDLTTFPFDEHTLSIDVGDRDALDVKFVADESELSGKEDLNLPGWTVTDSEAKIETEDLGGGLKDQSISYQMTIRRPKIAAFAKNLLPAFTMVLVLFISLVMKPKMAAARLAAGTGSFVAVIMFHNTAASQLPPLGFLTLLDKFMFTLYAMWIMHIAMSIGILRADEAKNEARAMSIYKAAFIVLPVFALIAWGLVFGRVLLEQRQARREALTLGPSPARGEGRG